VAFHNLTDEVQFVKGIGPRRALALAELGITTVGDLLFHLPRRYLDRSLVVPIAQLREGMEATVVGRITGTGWRRGRRRDFFEMVLADNTGYLTCRWFNGAKWLARRFKRGMLLAVSGRVEFYHGLQMVHPDFDFISDDNTDPLNTGIIVPLYPSTMKLRSLGLDSRGFRRVLKPLLPQALPLLQDSLPEELLTREDLLPLQEALAEAHFPASLENLERARRRLKFEELFYLQLILALRRHSRGQKAKPHRYQQPGAVLESQYKRLPYELTSAQKRVMREIWADLKKPSPMNRLLQGEVGSGKTVVAFLTVAIAAGNGYQSAFMAPTEILAEQHFQNARRFFAGSPVKTALLLGAQKAKEKEAVRAGLRAGEIHLVVGTHALIQETVNYQRLQLVIIDEQHRFGVLQRAELIRKGLLPDVLVMTATPIPRTLTQTLYGDLAVSVLDELPPGRQPIITRKVEVAQLPQVYEFVRKELQAGHQAYVVYPLIEASEKMDLEAAEKGFRFLQEEVFPEFKLALLHGRMNAQEKEAVMAEFVAGRVQMLVSTTVIEVGVDVPNATIMIIENAERFGLSQLHQLRGRIGRGSRRGVCILVTRKITEESQQRLAIITATTDGFRIAEEDWKLRGGGDIFGTQQHGFPKLKVADLFTDQPILQAARRAAFDLVERDPQLRKPEHAGLRTKLLSDYRSMLDLAEIA